MKLIHKFSLIFLFYFIGTLNSCGNITQNIGFGLSNNEIEGLYKKTESMYNSILDGNIESSKKNWDTVIEGFSNIIKDYPKSEVADDAQFNLGLCYIWANDFFKDSPKKAIKAFDRLTWNYPKSKFVPDAYYWRGYAYYISEDYKRAKLEFERFRMKFPKSSLYDDAEYQINECLVKIEPQKPENNGLYVPKEKPREQKTSAKKQDEISKKLQKDDLKPPDVNLPEVKPKNFEKSIKEILAKKDEKPIRDVRISVNKIRYHSFEEYTRIVADLSKDAKYDSFKLDKPSRICINIQNAVISIPNLNIDINDRLAKGIRSSQFNEKTVRIVIDLKEYKDYKIFSIENPFRIVVDIFAQDKKANSDTQSQIGKQKQNNDIKPLKEPSPTLVKQLGLKVKTIVIDPGHGGKDPGAVSKSGLYEKNFVLDIAQRLEKLLKNKGLYDVYLTRENDTFIPLEKRTAFANQVSADIFVSIHINSSKNSDIRGIETYYLSIANDEESRLTAVLENSSSERGIRDLGTILSRMLKGTKIDESRAFANIMQSSLCNITGSNNRGVRRAPFIVLIGAESPSILVELGFISNSKDEKLLDSDEYKDKLAKALLNGIEEYVKIIDPTG